MIDVVANGGVTTITLNRPDKANALTEPMLQQVLEAVQGASAAAAVILTGAGKVFSAGADLDAARAGLATSGIWEDVSGAIAALKGLTIAALNGTVAGGATGMVLGCDLRIAVPSAKFFYPVMKLGYLPQPSDPARMAALIGPSRTKLILLGGQKITAEQALSFGLVDDIVPADDLMERVRSLCADTVAADRHRARAIKALCP